MFYGLFDLVAAKAVGKNKFRFKNQLVSLDSKPHCQVTLTPQIRAKAGVEVGDVFEAKVEG